MYFYLFKSSQNNQWYWHFKSANHKVIAAGGEGYYNKQDAIHAINLVKANAASSPIYDATQSAWA